MLFLLIIVYVKILFSLLEKEVLDICLVVCDFITPSEKYIEQVFSFYRYFKNCLYNLILKLSRKY